MSSSLSVGFMILILIASSDAAGPADCFPDCTKKCRAVLILIPNAAKVCSVICGSICGLGSADHPLSPDDQLSLTVRMMRALETKMKAERELEALLAMMKVVEDKDGEASSVAA